MGPTCGRCDTPLRPGVDKLAHLFLCNICAVDYADDLPEVSARKDTFQRGFEAGFISALRSFGIYRNGEQVIGCREHNVKELIEKIQSGADDWFNTELSMAKRRNRISRVSALASSTRLTRSIQPRKVAPGWLP